MIRAFFFVLSLLVLLRPTTISAAPARWIHVQYRPYQEVDIPCSVGYICEVALEAGEALRNSLLPSEKAWETSMAFEGNGILTPHLILSPHAAGLASNLILTTNRRVYRFAIRSVADNSATYVFFHYDLARPPQPRPAPTPTSFNPRTACVSSSFSTYHMNGVRSWRPIVACNDGSHTYLQLPSSSTIPTDLPVIFSHLDRERKDQIVNWTFDAQNRVYRIDGVFDHLVLAIGHERLNVFRNGR